MFGAFFNNTTKKVKPLITHMVFIHWQDWMKRTENTCGSEDAEKRPEYRLMGVVWFDFSVTISVVWGFFFFFLFSPTVQLSKEEILV